MTTGATGTGMAQALPRPALARSRHAGRRDPTDAAIDRPPPAATQRRGAEEEFQNAHDVTSESILPAAVPGVEAMFD